MTIIPQVATALQTVFNLIAYDLGRSSGLVQREGKLTGASFVQALVFTFLTTPAATGAELTQTAAALGITISASGLTQRFPPQAATLLREVLTAAIKRVLLAAPGDIAVLDQFCGLFGEDSSVIVLPAALRDLWRGCGNAHDQDAAALKLTLCLDLCSGVIAALRVHAGRTADQTAAAPLTTLPAGALYLADLGFFVLRRRAQVADQAAFSRLRAPAPPYLVMSIAWRTCSGAARPRAPLRLRTCSGAAHPRALHSLQCPSLGTPVRGRRAPTPRSGCEPVRGRRAPTPRSGCEPVRERRAPTPRSGCEPVRGLRAPAPRGRGGPPPLHPRPGLRPWTPKWTPPSIRPSWHMPRALTRVGSQAQAHRLRVVSSVLRRCGSAVLSPTPHREGRTTNDEVKSHRPHACDPKITRSAHGHVTTTRAAPPA